MQRLSNGSQKPLLPAPSAPVGDPGYHHGGNPATEQGPSTLDEHWCNGVQEELIGAIAAAGITPSHADLTQLAAAIRLLADSRRRREIVITHQTNSSTDGGSNSAGMNIRPLNTVHDDPGGLVAAGLVALGSGADANRVRLAKGARWRASAVAQAGNVSGHQLYLYDVTSAATVAWGLSVEGAEGSTGDNIQTTAILPAKTIDLTGAATDRWYELRHYTEVVHASVGLGRAIVAGGGVEIYAALTIEAL
jgi:hypothetical protein